MKESRTGEYKLGRSTSKFHFDESWFAVEKVGDGILSIREPHHFEDVVSYFVEGEKASVLIDTGMGLSDIRKVLPQNADPLVLLTHSHYDHIGSASDFKNVAIFDDEFETVGLQNGYNKGNIPGLEAEYFTINVPPSFDAYEFSIPGKSDFELLKNEQIIDLGERKIQVIHTPGHTPGSVSFFLEEEGLLFTGDTIYPGPIYLHMDESDPDAYEISLVNLQYITRDKLRLIYPGHNATLIYPQLLDEMVTAYQGYRPPINETKGHDEFGPYIQRKWPTFSFLLPNTTGNS